MPDAIHGSQGGDGADPLTVGGRRGKPVVFEVDTHRMHADGASFWQSENGVWLVESVASKYLARR